MVPSYIVGISGWYLCEVEWLSQVADVKVNASRVITLSKDVRSKKKEVVMTTKIGIHLHLSGSNVRGLLTVETNREVTSCIIIP